MLHITRLMINEYKIVDMDFMGYSVDRDTASFHHLIIPRRNGGIKSLCNGAILNKHTSHPYLHIIELKDYEIFYSVTREMIKENLLGRVEISSVKKIDDMLSCFEKEHCGDINFNGEEVIKEEYTLRLLK